ncbi:ferredoxin [Amycolatopsis suaedae]|uniref:Ferredoxin n=2 Tax=Amycolatopsis suaedae TaxID=2510978 RepID=A0A4Q7J7L3_9PSEU|nr:ferredoxin [Amycolatopsis suaedae]
MCLTLCWGVLTATGWVRRLTGHHALRTGHAMLAVFTLATGFIHAAAFAFLDDPFFTVLKLIVPLADGGTVRHALGIAGFELMLAIAVTAGLSRSFKYLSWLRFHQLAYVAVGLTVVHSWIGAMANGHLAVVWIAGITVLAPTVTLAILRWLPPHRLIRIGLLDATPVGPPRQGHTLTMRVSVDNQRCRRYGICQSEAPEVFRLQEDGRLQYSRSPDPGLTEQVQAAARACPMRAIQLQGVEQGVDR